MAIEWMYMNRVNLWDKMDVGVSANAEELPQLEINLGKLRGKSQRARSLFSQQASLQAAKQEVTKELQQVIEEGDQLLRFLSEGLRDHYGKGSEKLIAFGVQPFRGLNRKTAPKPTPETVAPPAVTPDPAK